MELDQETLNKIRALSDQGNHAADAEDYEGAREAFLKALQLVPEPRIQWEASTWILTAIGDIEFLSGNYEAAREALIDCMHCPNAIGNPFIHLRLGQAQYEMGDFNRAGDELTRAYMGAGIEIFENEDNKYFIYLKTILKMPASGKW